MISSTSTCGFFLLASVSPVTGSLRIRGAVPCQTVFAKGVSARLRFVCSAAKNKHGEQFEEMDHSSTDAQDLKRTSSDPVESQEPTEEEIAKEEDDKATGGLTGIDRRMYDMASVLKEVDLFNPSVDVSENSLICKQDLKFIVESVEGTMKMSTYLLEYAMECRPPTQTNYEELVAIGKAFKQVLGECKQGFFQVDSVLNAFEALRNLRRASLGVPDDDLAPLPPLTPSPGVMPLVLGPGPAVDDETLAICNETQYFIHLMGYAYELYSSVHAEILARL